MEDKQKIAKAKKAFSLLLYSCNLYSGHRHTDDLRSPVSRIRRRMNQRLTHSWSPRCISRGGRPWKAESLCIQLAKWAGTATSAASDRQQDISWFSILRKKNGKNIEVLLIGRCYFKLHDSEKCSGMSVTVQHHVGQATRWDESAFWFIESKMHHRYSRTSLHLQYVLHSPA